MNAILFEGGKVHRVIDAIARCGAGKRRKFRQWQLELGEVTCQRCALAKPAEPPGNQETKSNHG